METPPPGWGVSSLHTVETLDDLRRRCRSRGRSPGSERPLAGSSAGDAVVRGSTASCPDFLVNTTTALDQLQPAVTALADGRVVFTWFYNDPGDGSVRRLRARIYDPANPSASADFIVNTTTTLNQFEPAVTTLADGRVASRLERPTTTATASARRIRARIYDPRQPAASADFIVNTTTAGYSVQAGGDSAGRWPRRVHLAFQRHRRRFRHDESGPASMNPPTHRRPPTSSSTPPRRIIKLSRR